MGLLVDRFKFGYILLVIRGQPELDILKCEFKRAFCCGFNDVD
jgi:hypothetical protein